MELNKSLIKQTTLDKIPQGAWYNARNIVVGESIRNIVNEKGFKNVTRLYSTGNETWLIGYIEMNEDVVVFLHDTFLGASTCIVGIVDNMNTYRTIISSIYLNFSLNNPIRGDFTRNFKNERIIVWWDGLEDSANTPKTLNIDCLPFDVNINFEPAFADLNLLELFPTIKHLDITLNSVNDGGGKLATGAYWITRAYVHPDGSVTNFSIPSNPIFIYEDITSKRYPEIGGCPVGTISTKSITITLNNLSSEFNNLQIGLISRVGGVLSAKIIPNIKYNTTSKEITITGEESTAFDTSIGSIIVPNSTYKRVHSGVFLQDRLYLTNLKKEVDIDYQQYANNIKAEWVRTEDVSLGSYAGSYKDPVFLFDKKGFAFDEVYGFVMAFGMLDGTISNWFHIVGRAKSTIGIGVYEDDALVSVINGTNPDANFDEALLLDANIKYYQAFNTAKSDGTMGYWENYDETYPDEDCSDIKDAAGVVIGTLRNEKVRHHKMPDINQLNTWGSPIYTQAGSAIGDVFFQTPNLLALGPWAGAGNLDYDFPTRIASGLIDGSITDTSVPGLMTLTITTNETLNFTLRTRLKGNSKAEFEFVILNTANTIIFRRYLSINGNIFFTDDTGEQIDNISNLQLKVGYVIRARCTRENTIDSPSVLFGTNMLRDNFEDGSTTGKVLGVKFSDVNIPTHIRDKISCVYFGFLKRTTSNSTKVAQSVIDYNQDAIDVNKIFGIRHHDISHIQAGIETNYLKTNYYLSNASIMGISSIYLGGYTLNIAQTYNNTFRHIKRGEYKPRIAFPEDGITIQEPEYEIETTNNYTLPAANFVIASLFRYKKNVYQDYATHKVTIMGVFDAPFIGSKTVYNGDVHLNYQSLVHRINYSAYDYFLFHYVMENITNVELRHGSEQFPVPPKELGKFDLTSTDGVGVEAFNGWIYNDDYTSHNDLIPSVIFECLTLCDNSTNKFPFRIARSTIINTESTINSWRTFKVNEYYEMKDRDKGEVYRIDKYGGSLLINQLYSFFVAQVKDIIYTNDTDLFIGRGDIFDRDPREVVPSGKSNSFAGCQSLWGARVTKQGYIFVDKNAGKVFVFRGELEEVSANGMYQFFETHLKDTTGSIGDNPFDSNGIIIGFDNEENRLLITVLKEEQPYTLSYSFHREGWICLHDYLPIAYTDNVKGVFNFLNIIDGINRPTIYKMNSTEVGRGIYHAPFIIYPWYIDVVFVAEEFVRFMALYWETDFMDIVPERLNNLRYDLTLSHIMAYDNHRNTGLINVRPGRSITSGVNNNTRRVLDGWQYTGLRDAVIDKNVKTVDDFGNVDTTNIDTLQFFAKKSKFISKFIVVRFQGDNTTGFKVILKDVNVSINKSER